MEVATLETFVPLELNLNLSDKQFFELCQNNRNLRFERTATGEVIIMPPTGSDTGNRNGRLIQQLFNWTDTNDLGVAFDSSAGFKMPNGGNRSPDASWIQKERWDGLTEAQKQQFAPLCPDFVVELRSASDSLNELQDKMREYLENGVRLGWLIDRQNIRVEIYRPGQDVEIIESPETLSGEDVLPGFVLDLGLILS
ncbi:Uma2 family endonuclease [Phormidium pseudopriestleyi FRX01]|uniref:Uma2 family endonuclease n=1 Tax=Phormidium pseudopriestleyi FRX01 TaxID=1759528 RepID=A0ABS3FWA7_9CYAN|nr:Uma2 family endonuclease [Phormidium pseudopriestleyi]MBO0351381.1 Uma2 family endonuclease [Phormidium pseudopriestleyi FRX01]